MYLTFLKAVVLILKHAMFFQLSNDSQSALSQAEQNYQAENIDSKILEYLKTFSPGDSVKQFSEFIMATDIGLFIILSYTYISSNFQCHLSLP
jgi:hypothetical protein